MIHKKMMTSLVNKQQQINKIINKSISLHISTLHAIKNYLNKRRDWLFSTSLVITFNSFYTASVQHCGTHQAHIYNIEEEIVFLWWNTKL